MMIRFIARFITAVMIMSAPIAAFSQHDGNGDEHANSHADTHANEHVEEVQHDEHVEHAEEAHGDEAHHDAHSDDAHHEAHGSSSISIPLPVILYVPREGFDVFMSSEFASNGAHHNSEFVAGDFIIHHIADAYEIHIAGEGHHGPLYRRGTTASEHLYELNGTVDYAWEEDKWGSINDSTQTNVSSVWEWNTDTGSWVTKSGSLIDISITKSVFGMLLIILLMILMLKSAAKNYARRPGLAPKGIASVMEPLILFIRDGVAYPILGKEKSQKFMPFLLTSFFFIVACNLLGLIPFIGGFNTTGTIGVTIVLAGLVFVITTINGNKHYWGHIVSPPGVPFFVKLILVPIEIVGILLKPTVLMIRLTANISAGHIIILSFVSLIFIFFNSYGVGGGVGVGIFSTLFMIFMYFLELLVAFLQAYVFTLLAAIYFSEATQEAHH